MKLYLTQHGLAVAKDVDPERPLSEQGRRDVRRLADFLANAGVRVEQVLHSGKTRAQQTAAILADSLSPTAQPQTQAGISPNDPAEPLVAEIMAWSADTLLVGHLPFLGRLAALLLAGDANRPTLAFAPGSMACLERDHDGRWSLCWMIRPELLPSADP